ncbi:hypothetical protein XHV734_0934 [Xanthomonas hortorum pv. vitians]|nr:hypothetical protein XHV734_0934 [Xanthomonas hortorum pv. vitians]
MAGRRRDWHSDRSAMTDPGVGQPTHARTGPQSRTSGTACDLLFETHPVRPPVGADAASLPGRTSRAIADQRP